MVNAVKAFTDVAFDGHVIAESTDETVDSHHRMMG
jgi:hypothetical protein